MTPELSAAFAFVASALGTWVINRFLLERRERLLGIDEPNRRSLHQIPTPNGGGLGIIIMTTVGWFWVAAAFELPQGLALATGAVVAVAAVSFIDDRRSLPPLLRLAVHLLAAVWVIASLSPISLFEFATTTPLWARAIEWLFTTLLLVWLINLYNFMDGMDGFAGGMTVIGFLAVAALGQLHALDGITVAAAIVAGAGLGFLFHNFPPASLFMGDVGAAALGLAVGVLMLAADSSASERAVPWWVTLVAFAPFVVDASLTLGKRALRGERVWEAHREHYYQRLVQSGWSHRKTTLSEYALMLVSGMFALAMMFTSGFWSLAVSLGLVSLYVLLIGCAERYIARRTQPGR